jgi:transforming growth factor-beta-induced protein
MVTTADIMTDNGIVHVIDAVIVPGSTVYKVIAGSADHNTLEAAIVAAGLQGTLSGAGPFTVFAPTDAAFEALPEGTVASLLQDPSGALTDVLLYHVLSGKVMSTDLSDGMTAATLAGSDITVSISGEMVMINASNVTSADIDTDNGVVHVIDAVLTPSTGIRDIVTETVDVSIYPNPASDFINVKYELESASEIRLEMYDMTGQQVRIQDEGFSYEGTYNVEVPVNDLKSGMYLLIINTGNIQVANKVRVVK